MSALGLYDALCRREKGGSDTERWSLGRGRSFKSGDGANHVTGSRQWVSILGVSIPGPAVRRRYQLGCSSSSLPLNIQVFGKKMAKRKSERKKPAVPLTSSVKPSPSPLVSNLVFPELSQKNDLKCRTILDDQILVIDVSLHLLRIGLHLTRNVFNEGIFLCSGMSGFYKVHRQTTTRIDSAQETRRGRAR